jgi:hypothetical protein
MGGSQFYMDDGEDHEHIRIRTRSGTQLLLDETNGLLYAINKSGTSWIEMDAEGNIDIFGAKSFSVRAQQDINFRADRDINVEAGRKINVRTPKDFIDDKDGKVGKTDEGDSGDINIESHGNLSVKIKKTTNIRGEGPVNIDGSITAVNKGAAQVTALKYRTKNNTLKTFPGNDIFNRDKETAKTIVTRFNTFEPCKEHGAKGDPKDFDNAKDLINAAGRYALVDDQPNFDPSVIIH